MTAIQRQSYLKWGDGKLGLIMFGIRSLALGVLVLAACGGPAGDAAGVRAGEQVATATLELAAPFTMPTDGVVPSQPFGTLEGHSKVTSDGAFSYDLRLRVPDGRAGLTPQVSLHYSSRAGNGAFGVGWSVPTLSRITRCKHTLSGDGKVAGLDFNTDYRFELNRYCLDGMPLLPTGETKPGTVVYSTERANFSRIIGVYQDSSNPAVAGDPLYFVVVTKDGQTIEYGVGSSVNNSRAEAKRWIRRASDAARPGA